jgi:hypothetical protein
MATDACSAAGLPVIFWESEVSISPGATQLNRSLLLEYDAAAA